MISISGLGSPTALRLIDATRDRQLGQMRDDPANKRAEAAFRERIGQITTPEELVADFEVYSFVMRAFDLEDQIFGKGMIRKILESDPEEPSSLLNRLTDRRFREMHLSLEFTDANGPRTPDFNNETWVNGIVDRFYNQQFINENDAQNETVGTVLKFRDEAGEIGSWFEVLRDKKLTKFFQVALGLPEQLSGLDLDVQKRLLEDKFDLSKLADPAERERLITKFMAISDVLNPPRSVASPIVSILSSASFGAQFVPITIDVGMVSGYSASKLYR